MTSEASTANEIPWGNELGEDWWRATAEEVSATPQQMKLAACLFAGMTRTAAARLAGYSSNDERARKSGSDAAKTNGVKTLLALATAEMKARNLPAVPRTLMTRDEAREKLTDIARGADKSLALRAVEAINKMDNDKSEGEINFFTLTDVDGLNDWRIVRDYLMMPNGAIAIAVLYEGLGGALAEMPLLLDLVAQLRREDEAVYDRLRRAQGMTSRALLDQRLSDPLWQFATRKKIWTEIGMTIEDVEVRAGGGSVNGTLAAGQMNGAAHQAGA